MKKKKKSLKDLYKDMIVYNNPAADRETINDPDEIEPKILYDDLDENYSSFQSKLRKHYMSRERMTFRDWLETIEELIDELI